MSSSRTRILSCPHSQITAVSPLHLLYRVCTTLTPSSPLTDYDYRASSTVALATELAIPMLVTMRTRRTYGFIDDDRIVVTRPQAMSEVQALRALRTGDASAFLASDPATSGVTMGDMPAVRAAVERMLHLGWTRTRDEWEGWRAGLWKSNTHVADRILRDMP